MSITAMGKPKKFEKKFKLRIVGQRNRIITVPETFLVMNGLKIGDEVFAYMLGEDLLFSKHEY